MEVELELGQRPGQRTFGPPSQVVPAGTSSFVVAGLGGVDEQLLTSRESLLIEKGLWSVVRLVAGPGFWLGRDTELVTELGGYIELEIELALLE